MTKLDYITFEITRNTINCIGYDIECDEDGSLFQVPCKCDTCSANAIEIKEIENTYGKTWRDFLKTQIISLSVETIDVQELP